MLTAILFVGCYIIRMWAMLLAFQRYMLPSTSGLKHVGRQVSVHIQHWFWKGWGEWTFYQKSCADGPFKGLGSHLKPQQQLMFLSGHPSKWSSGIMLLKFLLRVEKHGNHCLHSLPVYMLDPEDVGSMYICNFINITHIHTMQQQAFNLHCSQ
jgi:hypothetical protein